MARVVPSATSGESKWFPEDGNPLGIYVMTPVVDAFGSNHHTNFGSIFSRQTRNEEQLFT